MRHYTHKIACLVIFSISPIIHADIIADIPAGTGFAALDLCTRVIQSGDDYGRVRNHYTAPIVDPLPLVWNIGYQKNSLFRVSSLIPFNANTRVAQYRKGLGCTVLPYTMPERNALSQLTAQPFLPINSTPIKFLPWPNGENASEGKTVLSAKQNTVMSRLANKMFTETTLDSKNKKNTTAFLVAYNGKLVYEKYPVGYTRNQTQLGWSMTKSLTGLLAGIMATDGTINLKAPVDLTEWRGTNKSPITWMNLLNMASGFQWNEGYTGASDVTQMLYSQENQGQWAANRPLVAPPGTLHNYSTGTANLVMYGMKQKLGGQHQAIYNFYQNRLFTPLAMQNALIEPDFSGTPVGGARGLLRPIDWLKLGQLVLQNGQWNGKTIISTATMSLLKAPSQAYGGYAGLIWLKSALSNPEYAMPANMLNKIPDDMLYFAGVFGQYTIIIPSKKLVIVRMGVSPNRVTIRQEMMQTVADLVQAF